MRSFPKVTKAIIAVAGNATRFLPATKNQPKQMLPIIDKPIIHHVVDECVASGITDIILVTQQGQSALEDYFDSNIGLEYILELKNKDELLEQIREIPQMANFVYVRQKKTMPYGNGTPLLCAKNLIDNDEAVAFLFGDDLVKSKTPCLKQLIDVYEKERPTAVMAVQEVPLKEVFKYGVVEYKDRKISNEIAGIVEKPKVEEAPSTMAEFGRFIFAYDVVSKLEETPLGKGNELWIVDALNTLAKEGKKIIAEPIEGRWVTTGDPLNYLMATVEFALDRKDLGEEFKKYLKSLSL
ncbi:UTP--glucose-1-phosphate uridylyltransferase [candidate division WWE3 bacterium CG08_land_8_20_14_0_20_40_13]|uniref:UTP--glucose-1-phosphate uridylyltransferase n=1 Tax=candidate division WWE3 bacterium CG08_land_8_20_14_0_20_40_13 TaxID=1975084 RepID=A0A2H0XD34_UNCKA|nr:MAG: UTP--glucose-1-phosphate uridylyltransferase [candidate division WWE3 bacterium CG08_land_8_20_14_0_20_40_13]